MMTATLATDAFVFKVHTLNFANIFRHSNGAFYAIHTETQNQRSHWTYFVGPKKIDDKDQQ